MPGFKRNSRARRRVQVKRYKDTAKIITIVILAIILGLLCILSWKNNATTQEQIAKTKEFEQSVKTASQNQENQVEEEKPAIKDNIINIIALGNIICEPELYNSLYSNENETYLFIRFLSRIQQYIEIADYTVATLDTTFANMYNEETNKRLAPKDLAFALKNAGIDLLSTATRHGNDYKQEGIKETLDYLDESQLEHIGTNRTKEESEKIKTANIRGIQVAFLAYAENSNVDPSEKYSVNKIEEKRIEQDINKAKDDGAELIVVMLNWEDEKSDSSKEKQKQIAKKIVNYGADIILGTGPDASFEIEKIKRENEKEAYVIYSLGSFISLHEKTQISLNIEVKKSAEDGSISITRVEYTPMYLLEQNKPSERYYLSNITQEIERYEAGVQNNLTDDEYEKAKQELEELKNRMNNKKE